MTAAWFVPAIAFVALQGMLGIAIKLALREIVWPQLILYTATSYAVIAALLMLFGGSTLPLTAGAGWAIVTSVIGAAALFTFFTALERGDASKVVPLTASYPVVTTLLAATLLDEEITPARGLGTLMVIAGIVFLSRD